MLAHSIVASALVLCSTLAHHPSPPNQPTEDDKLVSEQGKVTDVMLYRNQARVTRSIDFQGTAGNLELVVGSLPENVQADSLFAEGGDGVEVRAVQFRTRAVGTSPREEVRTLNDEIVALNDKMALNKKNLEIVNQKASYLTKLETTTTPEDPSDLSFDASDLERMTLFIFEQRELIAPRQIELSKENRELSAQLNLLNRKMSEITNSATKTIREAIVYLTLAADSKGSIRLNYLVNNCGWSPTYTIRSNEERTSARFDYNGLIYQMSGEDWSNVTLSLSTASPALSAAGPGLAPLRVSLTAVQPAQQAQLAYNNPTKSQINAIINKQQSALRGNRHATNNLDFNESNWSINEAAAQCVQVELLGDSSAVSDLKNELNQLVDAPSLTYELANNVTLTSRNSRQMVRIVSSDLPSDFYHVATPVLTNYVYREAEVRNNSSEDLLAGPITVYLDDKFVGRGEIPTVARGQTFVVGFGADPQLRTRRELNDKTDGINGGNRELKLDYRLVVENFKEEAVDIRLFDRMPTAVGDRNIRVTRNDFSTKLSENELYKRVEKPKGILRWDVSVAAGATETTSHEVSYSYTLEYDRNFVVTVPLKPQLRQEFEDMQRSKNVR